MPGMGYGPKTQKKGAGTRKPMGVNGKTGKGGKKKMKKGY